VRISSAAGCICQSRISSVSGSDVTARTVTPGWRALVRFETDRAGALYSSADEGIELLPAWSARSIRTARVLHARILDEIVANDYDVFSMRARVPEPCPMR
jgi:15-cis-phytoene synthase